MNIILLTILLTLFGAGLIVLLVWLSVVSCKLIKDNKKHDNFLIGVDESLTSGINNLYIFIEDYKKEIKKDFEKIYDDNIMIQRTIEENRLSNERDIEHIYDDIPNRIEKLDSAIDSRIDKLHNMIKDKKKD